MKSGADFEQACRSDVDRDPTFGRLGYERQELKERTLARAVAANDAEHLATLDLKADVLERPELFDRVVGDDRAAACHAHRLAPEIARAAGQYIAQSDIALVIGDMTDQVFLAEPLGTDHDIPSHIQITLTKLRSVP